MRLKWNRLLVIPLLIIVVLAWVLWPQKDAEAGWYNDNWLYRLAYDITNSGSAINAERKIKLDIDTAALITAGKLQSDCDDARFTDANGKLLEYFIDTDSGACNTNSTDFYIKVPSVLAGKQTLYFYYGNATAPQGRKNDFFATDTTGQALKAYYKMDEASANTCSGGTNDTCDYALTNDGAWNGDTTYAGGKINNGTSYDGVDDYTNLSNESNFDFTTALTISAWVNRGTLTESSPRIFEKWYGGGSTRAYDFFVNNSSVLGFSFSTDGITSATCNELTGTGTVTPSVWHHVTATYSAGTTILYVDGTATRTCTGQATSINTNNMIPRLGIGWNGTDEYNGMLDDVRVYNRALTAGEISQIYNSGNGSSIPVPLTFTPTSTSAASEEKSPAPVAYWSFDEGTGTTAYDGVSGNNGTLTNGPVWKNESECISGKCIYFDGTNDYLSHGNLSNLRIATKTISFWAKPNVLSGFKVVFSAGSTNYYVGFNDATMVLSYGNASGTQVAYYSSNVVVANEWHYYTYSISVSGSNVNLSLYKDGQQVATRTDTNGHSSSFGTNFYTGAINTSSLFYKGSLDEVKIYPYARSADQIKADYNARGTAQGANTQIGDTSVSTGDTLSNGLVAYYPMDESTANTCSGGTNDTCDRSGNSNDGAWNGDATTGAGKYGSGVSLDGTGDYIDVGVFTPNTTFPGDNISVSAWFKTSSNTTQAIASLGDDQGNQRSWMLKINLSGKLVTESGGTGATVITGTTTVNDGRWHLATFAKQITASGSGKYTLYLDGQIEGSTSSIEGVAVMPNKLFTIGSTNLTCCSLNTRSNLFTGFLDEVRIYNRALSPAEVRALYNWAPGPVAHWKLDDKTGTSASDASGNSNSGTLTNGPAWTAGKYGSSVKFDGSNDYVSIADSNSLDSSSQFTVSTWVNPQRFAGSNQTQGFIFSKGSYPDYNYRLSTDSVGGNRFQVAAEINNSFTYLSTTNTFNTSRWYYLTGTYDGSTLKIYVDGILENSSSISGSLTTNTNAIYLGRYEDTTDWMYQGLIDDVRIYNYALNQKQIMNVMRGGDVNDTAVAAVATGGGGPVLFMNFDEGNGTTARDSSSQGNNGTLTNMASPATSTSGWTNSGKFGKAISFDGTNDYINAGTSSALEPTSALAVSTWVKRTSALDNFTGIFSSRKDSGNAGGYLLTGTSANKIRFYIWKGSWAYAESNSAIPINEWQYVTGIWDGTTIKLYINGILQSTIGSATSITYTTPTQNHYIGLYGASPTDRYWPGLIDEVKIYNYALTEDEVRLEYNRGSAVVFGAQSTDASGRPSNSSLDSYCPPASPAEASQCVGPVAEWKLDEGTGTTAQDTSGGGNTGTLTNGPVWTKGKLGKALKFDGSDDYVDGGTSIGKPVYWTMSGWIKPSSISNNAIIFSTDSSGANNNAWGIYGRADNVLSIYVSSGSSSQIFFITGEYNTINYPLNSWTYISATVDGSNIKYYRNGTLVSSTAQTVSMGGTGYKISLAKYGDYNGLYFPGQIDNVRIYNYARTPAQIAWEYNKGAPIAHYRLDECQGTTAYNSAPSANGDAPGNNGTISIGAGGTNTSAGTCTGSAGEAWKDGATGKLGASLEFDGTDDYVDIANPNVNLTTAYTWCSWINSSTTVASSPLRFIIQNGASSDSWGFSWSHSTVGFQQAVYHQNASSVYSAAKFITPLQAGTWYFICGQWDGSSLKAYLNGRLETTTSSVTSVKAQSGNVQIGGASSSRHFHGLIDDVRIYNYALTNAQVRTLYNDGAVAFK